MSNKKITKRERFESLLKIPAVSADLTNQKVSALVRQLKTDNLIVKTEDKRKAYFSKA